MLLQSALHSNRSRGTIDRKYQRKVGLSILFQTSPRLNLKITCGNLHRLWVEILHSEKSTSQRFRTSRQHIQLRLEGHHCMTTSCYLLSSIKSLNSNNLGHRKPMIMLPLVSTFCNSSNKWAWYQGVEGPPLTYGLAQPQTVAICKPRPARAAIRPSNSSSSNCSRGTTS